MRVVYFFAFFAAPPFCAPAFVFPPAAVAFGSRSGPGVNEGKSFASSLSTRNKVYPLPHATRLVVLPSKDGTKSGLALDFFPFGP